MLAGFGASLLYLMFQQGELVDSYITLRPDVQISKYDHVYYIGERFNLVAFAFIIYMLKPNAVTMAAFFLYVLYFFDFKLLFNDPYPGMPYNYSVIMVGCLIILLLIPYEWKRLKRS